MPTGSDLSHITRILQKFATLQVFFLIQTRLSSFCIDYQFTNRYYNLIHMSTYLAPFNTFEFVDTLYEVFSNDQTIFLY